MSHARLLVSRRAKLRVLSLISHVPKSKHEAESGPCL